MVSVWAYPNQAIEKKGIKQVDHALVNGRISRGENQSIIALTFWLGV
jgi:hypothetical protein